MHVMIEKFVNQGFITKEEGEYLEKSIENKDSIIVSGHRSAATRQLMASLMAVAKSQHSSKQVKGFDDLTKDVDYLLIPGIPGIDFEQLIQDAMALEATSFISIKEPDHPYSIMKLLRNVFKETGDTSKVYQVIECSKIDDSPKVVKITQMTLNEKGRLEKKDL